MRKRDTSIFEAKFQGWLLKPNSPSRTCYNRDGDPKTFEPGTFVPNDVIKKFGMKHHWFIHPDTLRLAGAFEFAHKKKGKFSVGIARMMQGRGDILMASVLAKALKYRYGDDVECWFALKGSYAPILENNPYIDRVFSSYDMMMKALPDININVDDLEFKIERKDFERDGKITRNRASIYLEQLGLHLENKTPVYVVTKQERAWARRRLRELGYKKTKPVIGIQLYGSNPSRTYPFMDKVIEQLEAEGNQIILLDDKVNGKYEYSLREVGALIDSVDVTVTPNSYLYHLAGALKARAVAIFGYTDGDIWTEDYEKVTPVEIPCPEKKSKCWWQVECNPGKTLGEKERAVPPCLRQITPAKICEAVSKHLTHKRKILVVVLTYNFVNMSVQMVDSIKSFHDYDVVVIDNESTDDTKQWAKEEGIEFISKKQSVAAAWNQGLKLAYERGYDHCLLCNNDVILSPTYIDTVVECLERRNSYAATGNVIDRAAVKVPALSRFSEMIKKVEVPIMGQKAGDYSALLVSRQGIEKVGKFNEAFGPRYQADEDHLLRTRLAGSEVTRTYATTFLHLLGQVIKKVPEARATHLSDWERNTKLFKKMWNVDLYSDRKIFNSIDEIKRRNPNWKNRILIPIDGKSAVRTTNAPGCLKEAVDAGLNRGKSQVKVYVVRQMGGMGDILFTTVVAKALKDQYGDKVAVHYGVLEKYFPLLQNNPDIDDVIRVQRNSMHPRGYDYVLDLTDYEFQAELREIGTWHKVTRPRTRMYLDLAGLDGELKPTYVVSPNEEQWANMIWNGNGNGTRIVMVEKGSNLMKVWPGMKPLYNKLKADGHSVLLLDGKKSSGSYKYSFRQAGAIVSTANLVIAPDSGISNLAAAIDKPAVTIFANRNGELFSTMFDTMIPMQGSCPIHKENYCGFKADCFDGELDDYLKKENIKVPQCLEKLTVERVYNKVKAVLK